MYILTYSVLHVSLPPPTTAHIHTIFSPPEVPPPTLSVSSQALIRNILLIVGYLFRENKRYLPDYRIALLKTATMARPSEVQICT